MIIGISGKKQHGKNTFTAIAQYLIWKSKIEKGGSGHLHYSPGDFMAHTELANQMSGWKQKQFAEKLKQVVCLLLGCTMAQLEDNSFKEKVLGEEWHRWYLTHYKAAHKGNPTGRVSHLFSSRKEAEEYKNKNLFAPGVGDIVSLAEVTLEIMTPRKILQYIGTDGGRNIVHPDIWVNATMADYVGVFRGGGLSDDDLTQDYPDWFMTDVRFPNEAVAIKKKGGKTVRVQRLDLPDETDQHESETALDDYTGFDVNFTVEEAGINDEYINQVRDILLHLKVL